MDKNKKVQDIPGWRRKTPILAILGFGKCYYWGL